MKKQFNIKNFSAFFCLIFLSFQQLMAQQSTTEIELPIKEVMNTLEGHFFNDFKVFIDEYKSDGRGGAKGWFQIGNGEKTPIHMDQLHQFVAQRWHIDNMMSDGVDLKPSPSGDPKKWIITVYFEENGHEIICINRTFKTHDWPSSGHITGPRADIHLRLVNSENSISYVVEKAEWKGKANIKIHTDLVDRIITRSAKPKIEKQIIEKFNAEKNKAKFSAALQKVVTTLNTKFKNSLDKYDLPSPQIQKFHIKGNQFVVTIAIPARYFALLEKGTKNTVTKLYSSWEQLMAGWAKLVKDKKRLIDLESFESNGKRYYSTVWENGDDKYAIYHYSDWKSFTQRWSDLAKQNQRLVDIETYQSGDKRWYIGVWRGGTDGHALYQYDSYQSFMDKKSELSKQNFKLIDIETFTAQGKRWYIGVWRSGTDGALLKFESPLALWSNLGTTQKDLYPLDVEIFYDNFYKDGNECYLVLYGRGKKSWSYIQSRNYEKFTAQLKEKGKSGFKIKNIQPF